MSKFHTQDRFSLSTTTALRAQRSPFPNWVSLSLRWPRPSLLQVVTFIYGPGAASVWLSPAPRTVTANNEADKGPTQRTPARRSHTSPLARDAPGSGALGAPSLSTPEPQKNKKVGRCLHPEPRAYPVSLPPSTHQL